MHMHDSNGTKKSDTGKLPYDIHVPRRYAEPKHHQNIVGKIMGDILVQGTKNISLTKFYRLRVNMYLDFQ